MIVHCAPGLDINEADVQRAPLFTNWIGKFDSGWELSHFTARDDFTRDGVVHMLFAKATLRDPDRQSHTRIVFLRGGTVDILAVLVTPDGEEHVALVEEKRVAVGRTLIANPAGMIDEGELPVLAAIRELGEEVDDTIAWSKPVSLNEKILGENIPMLVSPGGTDEEVFFYVTRANVSHRQLETLNGATGGVVAEDELTTVHIIPIREARRALCRSGAAADLKAVSAVGFYLE